MLEYRVVLARSAERDLQDLPGTAQKRVLEALERLANAPRPRGVRKLGGGRGLWRVRVGDYRVVYSIDDHERAVDVTHVRHRRDAYR